MLVGPNPKTRCRSIKHLRLPGPKFLGNDDRSLIDFEVVTKGGDQLGLGRQQGRLAGMRIVNAEFVEHDPWQGD